MIITATHLLRGLRWVPPAVVIIGSGPLFLDLWSVLRTVTLPLSDRMYRRLEEKLYSSYQAMVGFFYETWSGVEFVFYGDQIPNEPENVLYISNHQCSVDWVIPEVLCVKQGHGGRAKYLLKDHLKYVPLYGWYLGQRGGIFVKRQKDRDTDTLIRGLNAYVEKDMPVWLVIFPEGTRFSPQNSKSLVRERSREYARSIGLPELSHVLTPRTAGFEIALKHIRNHFKAVYDLTIFYEGFGCRNEEGLIVRGPPPNLFGFFSGQCARVHIHVRRVPIEDIPQNPEEQRTWLYDAYQRKERLIDGLLENGRYSAPKHSHPLPLSVSGPPAIMYAALLTALMSHKYGRWLYIGTIGFFTLVTVVSGALKS